MSRSKPLSECRPKSLATPRYVLHGAIVLHEELEVCNKKLDKYKNILYDKEKKISKLTDKILELNDKIREKTTEVSIHRDMLNSKFNDMWAMSTRRTGFGTRRGKKRKMRRTRRGKKRKMRRTKRR